MSRMLRGKLTRGHYGLMHASTTGVTALELGSQQNSSSGLSGTGTRRHAATVQSNASAVASRPKARRSSLLLHCCRAAFLESDPPLLCRCSTSPHC